MHNVAHTQVNIAVLANVRTRFVGTMMSWSSTVRVPPQVGDPAQVGSSVAAWRGPSIWIW